ncbi:MAG TPA: type I pullulanase, partial [bacterium]|nr:type I pullulanase [bacterium]
MPNKKLFLLLFLIFIFIFSLFAGEKLTIHYHRPDGDYQHWTLWVWGIHTNVAKALSSKGSDDFGVYFIIDVDEFNGAADYGMLPRYKEWERKDDPDRIFNKGNNKEFYIMSEDRRVYTEKPDVSPRVVKALLDSKKQFRVVLSKSLDKVNFSAADVEFIFSDNKKYPVISITEKRNESGKIKVLVCELGEEISVESQINGSVSVPGYKAGQLVAGKIVDDPYFYRDIELGAIWTPEATTFRTFAPTALEVYVHYYLQPSGGEPYRYKMYPIGNGIWEITLKGNLKNAYYKFYTVFVDDEYEIMDPYSKANTGTRGRCIIVGDEVNIPIAPGPQFDNSEAIISEIHIREISIDENSDVKLKGKYLGLTEEPTYVPNTQVTTNLSHLAELGVNVVQIMPFQDFDNDEDNPGHNWGYMPFHYNSPDGAYATKRYDITRIIEVKKMIDAFHKKGIKVVMDVVYNHTAEGNPEVRVSFNGLAPDYYYRLRDDGSYWNGSGCGNEFRSEAPMARKYIIDSLKYWVQEYKVDGFRFDLLGLIDLETVKLFTQELKKIKPDILIYGEPWTGGASAVPYATTKGTQKNQGFGVFNDNFRNAIKGGVSDKTKGYIQAGNNVAGIKKGVIGSITDFCAQPIETINYIECHDNYMLWDKIVMSTQDLQITDNDRIDIDKLAAAIILTSQGIPFLQVGQEFLRSKHFEDNPYNKGDEVNKVEWARKVQYFDVFNYYKNLIALRKAHPMFRFKTAQEIKENIYFLDDDMDYVLPAKCVAYVINKGSTNDNWENAIVIFNPNNYSVNIELPESQWYLVLDKNNYYPQGNGEYKNSVSVPSYSAMILFNLDKDFKNNVLAKYKTAKAPVKKIFKVNAPDAKQVTIAGSFNDWNKDSLPMKRDNSGMWSIELELEPGSYEYKFIQDGDWDKLNKDNRIVNIKKTGKNAILFEVYAPDARQVTIAGSFNDWNMSSDPLEKKENGKWQIYLDLAPGAYEYKFLQDGDWDKLNKENRRITVPAGGSSKGISVEGGSSSTGASAKGTTFEVDAPGARRVTIAGEFNNWDMNKHELKKEADGKWRITLDLAPGTYEYKFLQDGDWDKLNKENRKITVPAGGSSSTGASAKGTTFEVDAPGARRVTIAGEFNNWDMNKHELKKEADGKWRITLDLAPGTYEYKFLQDGDWDKLNKENRKITVPAGGSSSTGASAKGTTFEVDAPGARRVTIAGEFNNWDMNKHELKKEADGKWRITLDLAPGTYEYKFLQDGDWDKLNKENRKITVPAKKEVAIPEIIKKEERKKTVFEVEAPDANQVELVGSFNNWRRGMYFLNKQADGKWRIELDLEDGTYKYRFVQDGDYTILNKEDRILNVPEIQQEKIERSKGTTFEVDAPGARRVTIAGEFNNWDMNKHELKKEADGKWRITLDLAPGTYEYKFLQDGDWDKLNKENRKITVPAGGSSSTGASAKGTTFEVDAPGARRVTIAGEFNNWDMNKHELKKEADGKWRITLDLAPG